MTATSGISSTGSADTTGMNMGMNMSDLMAPLMMLMIERLLEKELSQDNSSGTAQSSTVATTSAAQAPSATSNLTSSAGATGSKPEPSGLPVQGARETQQFHTGHTGIDLAVPVGTPVRTTMDGKVIHAGWNDQGYGNLVIVENGAYRTYYAHLSSIPVSVGDEVAAGSTVGLSGNTGHSTGPHLHYEIRKNKVPIDPAPATFGTG